MPSGAHDPRGAYQVELRHDHVPRRPAMVGPRRRGALADETRARRFEAMAWIVIPLAGCVWVVDHISGTYYFYDEWSMIRRIVESHNAVSASFENFNGHLIFVTFWLYWIQLHLFGLGGHTFVYLLFTFSLVTMHVTLALLLRSAGVPVVVALLGAGLLVYFGVGSQSMLFEFQLSWNLAYTSGFLAASTALRCRPTGRAAGAVTGVLLLGLLCDSAIATLGILLVSVVLLRTWPRRMAIAAVALPAIAAASWSAGAGSGPSSRASVAAEAEVAWRLFAASAAGFGGRHGPGLVVVAVTAAVVVVGLFRGSFDRPTRSVTSAATVTLVTSLLIVTFTRAGIIGDDVVDVNRYVQTLGIYLLLTILPPTWRIVSRCFPLRAAQPFVAVVLLAMFGANMGPLNSYRKEFDAWNLQTRSLVHQSAALIERGCGPGLTLDLTAQPLANLGPQITVALLDRLRANGELPVSSSPEAGEAQPRSLSDICIRR